MLRWLGLAVLLAGITAAIVWREHLDTEALQAWLGGAGIWAPLAFMAIYAVATVLFLPGSVLTLAGGALFGVAAGTFINLSGATLGALLAFLLARHLGAEWLRARMGARMQRLVAGVEAEGWRFVAFTRLVPLFPFNALNYALGLTRIGVWPYLTATWLCMLPGALAYTYLGYAGREALAGGEGLIHKGLLALALLAVVAFLPRLVGRLRRGADLSVDELHSRLQAGDELAVFDVRTPDDFAAGPYGHLAAARNLPLETLSDRLPGLTEYAEHPIALICNTQKRSLAAARVLAANGFGNVRVVRGGMKAWHAAGYGLSAGVPTVAAAADQPGGLSGTH